MSYFFEPEMNWVSEILKMMQTADTHSNRIQLIWLNIKYDSPQNNYLNSLPNFSRSDQIQT